MNVSDDQITILARQLAWHLQKLLDQGDENLLKILEESKKKEGET